MVRWFEHAKKLHLKVAMAVLDHKDIFFFDLIFVAIFLLLF